MDVIGPSSVVIEVPHEAAGQLKDALAWAADYEELLSQMLANPWREQSGVVSRELRRAAESIHVRL